MLPQCRLTPYRTPNMALRIRFWWWVHNCVAHPLEGWAILFLGYCPAWIDRFHAWATPKD